MLYSICSARTCFEISLICKGFFFVSESNGGFNIPWCKFGGVRYMPCIVHSQAFLQIVCYVCVMALACSDITQNVNVVEMRGRHWHCRVFRLPHVLRHGGLPASALPPSLLRSYGVTSASAWQPPFFISPCCIKKLAWQTRRLAKPKFFLRKNGGWSIGNSNP